MATLKTQQNLKSSSDWLNNELIKNYPTKQHSQNRIFIMEIFNKNLLIIIIVLFTFLNIYTIDIEPLVAALENLITSTSVNTSSSSNNINTFDATPYNLTSETSTEKLIFQTVTYENKIIVMANYYNKETGHLAHAEQQLYPDNSFDNQNKMQFDLALPSSNDNIPDISHASTIPPEDDYLNNILRDSAQDAHQQRMNENYLQQPYNIIKEPQKVIREQDLQKDGLYFDRDFADVPLDSDLMLQKEHVFHDPRSTLSSPIIAARINRLITFYTYKTHRNSKFQAELAFCKAFKSGKVLDLLNQIYDSNLPTANAAFNELKKLWIQKRKHMFLVNNSYNTRELDFITKLGIDIMIKAERALVTRAGYIAEHADTQSLKIIQEYKKYCKQLQQKGNRSALLQEIKKLRPTVKKRSDFAIKISFAIAQKICFDPVTTTLHEIANTPSLEQACVYVKNLELQLVTQAQQQNIMNQSQMKTWTAEHYGFDTFFRGLNPLTQVSNMSHLATHLGSLLKKSGTALWTDPIATIHNGITTTFTLTELIRNTANFTSDLTVGKLYLSSEEYKQRTDAFFTIMQPLQGVTAEHCVDFVAQVTADVLFFKGLGNAYTFLQEIDVLEKLGELAAAVARTFKKGFDTHLANNPIVVTAEGVTIKMSEAMHNINNGGGGKNIINSSKALIESVYAPIAENLKAEIELLKKIKLPYGFAEFSHKPIRIAYEHILGMNIDLNKKGKLTLSGFHQDFKNAIEKSGALKFTNKILNKHDCYITDLVTDGLQIPDKTFFPAYWSRTEVINKINEAYGNFIKSGIIPKLNDRGKYMIRGFTNEGIEIEMCFTVNGEMKTAYPIVIRGI